MRAALAATLLAALAGPAVAQGSAAEDRYIATRDAAIPRFTPDNAPTIDDKVTAEEAGLRADLERQMRAILGDGTPDGFDAGQLNLSTLFTGDMGFGTLDGLVYAADGGKTAMVLTTRTLFQRWLKAHETFWQQEHLPRDAAGAFRTEAFYVQALTTDAAVVRLAELPLGVADKSAFAMLAGRTQDEVPEGAGEVFVAAVRGERMAIVTAKLDPPFAVPACAAARAASARRIAAAGERPPKAEAQRAAWAAGIEKMRTQMEDDFKRCFAAGAAKAPGFAQVLKTAKALYERIPLK